MMNEELIKEFASGILVINVISYINNCEEEYNNNHLVDTIRTLVNTNNGKWRSLKDLAIEQKKLYSNLVDNKVKNSMINSKLLYLYF